jgi:hypothetical protein
MLLRIFWNENTDNPSTAIIRVHCQKCAFSFWWKPVVLTLLTYVFAQRGKEWARIAVSRGVLLAADQDKNQIS